jgi:hypothetical protein
MYKESYFQLGQMAQNMLTEQQQAMRETRQKQKQSGIMQRISNQVEEESAVPLDRTMANYMKSMRERIQGEPLVEGGSVTNMASPEVLPEKLPEGTVRPQGRFEIPKGEVVDKVYAGLLERGVPDHVAKGFLLNFQDESGFNIDIVEKEPNVYGTRGKGLYQLTNDRRDAFEAKYGDDYSIDNQLDWLVDVELKGTEKAAFEKMLNTSTAGEAGAVIVKEFLRPAKKHQEARARKYLSATGYTQE